MNARKSEVLVTERGGGTEAEIQDTHGTKLEQTARFKYLGSVIAAEGGVMEAVIQGVNAAWMKWRERTGVISDKKVPLRIKGKLYKTVVRPVLLHGSECWAAGKKEEEMRTEMRMLRWIAGVSRREMLRNEEIRERCGIVDIAEKMREARLRWFGHMERREAEEPARMAMEFEVEGSRMRGRPRKRWQDVVESDQRKRGLRRGDALNRGRWRRGTRMADPTTKWDNG